MVCKSSDEVTGTQILYRQIDILFFPGEDHCLLTLELPMPHEACMALRKKYRLRNSDAFFKFSETLLYNISCAR
uniref:Uncharacterized protein n=1 Tax=Romanomermis culicivorax TaxID=13658 RepID=A0A915JED1_ROMCU